MPIGGLFDLAVTLRLRLQPCGSGDVKLRHFFLDAGECYFHAFLLGSLPRHALMMGPNPKQCSSFWNTGVSLREPEFPVGLSYSVFCLTTPPNTNEVRSEAQGPAPKLDCQGLRLLERFSSGTHGLAYLLLAPIDQFLNLLTRLFDLRID